tara:strand:+ start:366 stop:569 length:204 start_codon:yes stop_codon:yes gene_type:complete
VLKYGDLVQLKTSKELGIIIDYLEKNFMTSESLSRAYRKVLLFEKNNISIGFFPSCNIKLIQKKGNT